MKYFLSIVSSILLSAFGICVAQPANDAPCSSVSLTVGSACTNGTIVAATTEGMSTPSCWTGPPSNYSTSVWYSFTATDDSITINTGGGGTLGTQALTAVYSGTCGSLTQIACANGGNEANATGLVIGNTYFVMIDGQGTNTGTFCIQAYETPAPPPATGTCLNPRILYPNTDCNNIQGTQYDEQNNQISTNTATGGDGGASIPTGSTAPSESSCAGTDLGQNAYWVQFTATVTGGGGASNDTEFSNAGGSSADYQIYTGTCGSLTPVACYTIGAGSTVNVEAGLVAGTTYYVMITGAGSTNLTNAFLCITSDVPYVNPWDGCATSISANTMYTFNTVNATVNGVLCAGSVENNIWLSWTCPAGWVGPAYFHLFNQQCPCGNGTQMSVFNGGISCTPSGNQSGNCIFELNPNNDNDFYGTFTPTPGVTYLIELDGYAGCGCTFNFDITNTNMVPLPVRMISFTGSETESGISLEWITLSEVNSSYFSVERSSDGETFEVIGRVEAAGNSSRMKDYHFNDRYPVPGINYYRLVQYDPDGKSEMSGAIAVKSKRETFVKVYPNPATEMNFNLEILSVDDQELKIEIVDVYGKPVYAGAIEVNGQKLKKLSFDTSILSEGSMFYIRVISEEEIIVLPLVIAR